MAFTPIEGIHFNPPYSPPANQPELPAPPPTPSTPFYQPPTITADTPGVNAALLAEEQAMRAEGKLFINGKWTTSTAAGQQPDFKAATQPDLKQFYRLGEDIYNASTNQKIGATNWQQNWATDANSTEVQAATLTSPEGKKETVGVGTSYANNLLNADWTVGDKIGGGTAIDGNTLAPVEPIIMDDPTIPTDTAGSTITSAEETIKTIDDYMADVTPPETKISKEAGELTSEMSDILSQLEGQEAMRQKEEEKRGVDMILESLKTINNQLKIKLASYRQLQVDIQGKPITMNSIIGAQAQINAVAQADIGYLQAQSSALQNDLTFAQEQAQKAVNNKYAPLIEKYNLLIKQIELLQPQLNKEEKIYAAALARQYADQKAAIQDQKATEADIQNIALTALQNSGGDMAIYNQIVASGSVADAMSKAGDLSTGGWQYVATPAERDAFIAQGYEITQVGGRTYARLSEGAMDVGRQSAILGIINQGISDPKQIFDLINFDEQGNQVGDISIDEIKKVITSSKITGTGGGGGNGITNISTNDKKAIEQKLLVEIGDDGFLSPDNYNLAKEDWVQAKGEPAEFDKKFAKRRNPDNRYYKITGKIYPRDEDAIKRYKEDGYSKKEIKEAGFDEDVINKIFEEDTEDKKWYQFWK